MDGAFGDPALPTALHDHAVAALAMVEAYRMTESPIYKASAQRALDVLAAAHTPGRGRGRGRRDDPEDLATTAWAAMVFCSAKAIVDGAERRGKLAPVTHDAAGRTSALAFMERCTDVASGVVRDPAGPDGVSDDAATAMGAMVRLVAGENPNTDGPLARALAHLARRPPRVADDGAVIDPLAVVFGSFATFHSGGDVWKAWDPSLSAVLQNTRTAGTPCDDRGAYDVAEPRDLPGGRLATTALLALASSVYYRYDNRLACAR